MRNLVLSLLLCLLFFVSFASSEEFGYNYLDTGKNLNPSDDTFLDLTDTPSTYSGQATFCVKVNSAETALEFGDCGNATGGGNTTVYAGTNITVAKNATGFIVSLDEPSVIQWLDNIYYPLTGNPSNFINLNEYYANATQEFYPLTGNPSGFLTAEVDPYWSGNESSVARIGDCPSGELVQNITTGGVECLADQDTTYSAGQDLTLTGTTFASNRSSLEDFFDTLYIKNNTNGGYIGLLESLTVNGETSLGNSLTFTTPNDDLINVGNIIFETGATGGTLRTGTSSADKFTLQAYDVNDGVYVTVAEADAANEVVFDLFENVTAGNSRVCTPSNGFCNQTVDGENTTILAGSNITVSQNGDEWTIGANMTSIEDFFSTLFYPLNSNPSSYIQNNTDAGYVGFFDSLDVVDGELTVIDEDSPTRFIKTSVNSGNTIFNSSLSLKFYRDNVLKMDIFNLMTVLYQKLSLNGNDITDVGLLNATDITIQSGGSITPDVSGDVDVGTTALPFNRFRADDGFQLTTTGGAAALIPANSYFGAITASPTSGIYFNSVNPDGIEFHLAGTTKHKVFFGEPNSESLFYHGLRTTNATSTGTIPEGTYQTVKSGGVYYLYIYDGSSWVEMART